MEDLCAPNQFISPSDEHQPCSGLCDAPQTTQVGQEAVGSGGKTLPTYKTGTKILDKVKVAKVSNTPLHIQKILAKLAEEENEDDTPTQPTERPPTTPTKPTGRRPAADPPPRHPSSRHGTLILV